MARNSKFIFYLLAFVYLNHQKLTSRFNLFRDILYYFIVQIMEFIFYQWHLLHVEDSLSDSKWIPNGYSF